MNNESNELNSNGRYQYDLEFLRSLQCHPLSLKKPDLPDLDIVQQVPLPHRSKPTDDAHSSSTGVKKGNKIHRNRKSNTKSPIKPIPLPNDVALPSSESVQSPLITAIAPKPKSPPKSEIINEKKKSLLPLSNIHENCSTKAQTIQDIEYLLGRKFTAPLMNNDAEVQERCLIFFDKDDVKKLVEKEIDNHYKNKNFLLAYQVSALTGNLKETITEASRINQLNDWLVAMSASISREFWSNTALLYAMQLEKSNEFTQAAYYYSSLRRITDAARVLVKGGLFKESLILVKNCAPFDTELIQNILNAWAKSKESQEDWEFAAKIHVSNFESKEAARCLTQRKDDPKCESLTKIINSVTPLVTPPNYI